MGRKRAEASLEDNRGNREAEKHDSRKRAEGYHKGKNKQSRKGPEAAKIIESRNE